MGDLTGGEVEYIMTLLTCHPPPSPSSRKSAVAEGLCVCLPSLPELLILFLRFVQVRIYDLDCDFGTKKTQKCASHK